MTTTKIGEFVTIAREGAVATVTLDRGDGRNALSRQLILELTQAARSFAETPSAGQWPWPRLAISASWPKAPS